MKKVEKNREAWLRAAYAVLRKELLNEAPASVAVTWGFPSKGATARAKRRIGECWVSGTKGLEGDRAVLISPTLEDPLKILDVLLHEMIHAALPPGVGHRRQFSQMAARVGLLKPWTATTAGPELTLKLKGYLKGLPAWPGGHLIPSPKEKGRQIKATCGCGRILRGALRTLAAGPIICGNCHSAFEMETEGSLRKLGV